MLISSTRGSLTIESFKLTGGRKKALCCSPNPTSLETLTCDIDLCIGYDGCGVEDAIEGEGDGYYELLSKRSYELPNGQRMWSYGLPNIIEARVVPGQTRTFNLLVGKIVGSSLFESDLRLLSRIYSAGLKVFKGDGSSTLGLFGGFRYVTFLIFPNFTSSKGSHKLTRLHCKHDARYVFFHRSPIY